MQCDLIRNGQTSGSVVIEYEDDTITRGRFGAFLIGSANAWLPDDQFELQPTGRDRIPIVVQRKSPSKRGIVVEFCSYLDKWA
jgi:hypothetical protein